MAAGEAVAGFALTEPDAGSDVAALSLRAERDGEGFRLTGEKVWISNAPEADVYSVFARTTEGAGARGLTAFAVPRDSEGLSGERIETALPPPDRPPRFDGVHVPADHVLGEVDRGFAGRHAHARPLPPERRRVRGRDGAGGARRGRRARRARARVRQAAEGVPGGLAPARRRADARAGGAAARPPRRRRLRRRHPAGHPGGGDGEAAGHRGRPGGGRRRDPGPRRAGARARPPARAPLPRGARAADLRGRVGDPARDHRPRRCSRAHGRSEHEGRDRGRRARGAVRRDPAAAPRPRGVGVGAKRARRHVRLRRRLLRRDADRVRGGRPGDLRADREQLRALDRHRHLLPRRASSARAGTASPRSAASTCCTSCRSGRSSWMSRCASTRRRRTSSGCLPTTTS